MAKGRKVQVWISRVGKDGVRRFLLLLTRPERGAFWQPVTGSVEEGESFNDAALREAVEETGLSFQAPPVDIGAGFEFDSRWTGPCIEKGYALEADRDAEVRLAPQEHVDSKWVTAVEALREVKFESNAAVLRVLLQRLGGFGK